MIGWLPVNRQQRLQAALDAARRILKQLGVELHPQKTRIVHVGPAGFGVPRLQNQMRVEEAFSARKQDTVVRPDRMRSVCVSQGEVHSSFRMDQVRQRTKRTTPLGTEELIAGLNPLLRGWGLSITNAPTSESSSNVSTAGSGDAFGRIGTGVGAIPAGNGCLRPSSTASTSLFACSLFNSASLASWHR